MKNIEIIKNAILFPIRNIKQFIIVILLFLLSELIQEHFIHHMSNDTSIILVFIIQILLPLFVLGINLQIIFHIIDQNKGLPELSFRKSLKEATNDTLLESYYFLLTIIITIILAIPTGIFSNLNQTSTHINHILVEIEEMSAIEIMGSLPSLLIINFPTSILITLLILIIALILFFSMCTLGKIDMEEHHSLKQAFNLKYIFDLIKKIGIIRYLEFIVLVTIICIIVVNIVYILNFSPMLGSLFSAFLEAFTLTFFLYSFALLYPD